MEVLQKHYGNKWERKWIRMKKLLKKEYSKIKLNKKKYKKKTRHLDLHLHEAPSSLNLTNSSNSLEDGAAAHIEWNNQKGNSIHSTIRMDTLKQLQFDIDTDDTDISEEEEEEPYFSDHDDDKGG
eukprot:246981_1